MAPIGLLYHAGDVTALEWEDAAREWRDQDLARFARRAHRRLGRGFVLSCCNESQPIYVTWIVGAPHPVMEAVFEYDPEREAVVVTEDDDDVIIMNRVTIQSRH